ncbi:MAG: CNP1-like family protein [Burkholderiaceae bacterium]|jgi:hypothetical protein
MKLRLFFRPALLLTLFCATAGAQQKEADTSAPAWTESDLHLPAAPLKNNLLSFYVSPIATLNFAVDAKSVSVEQDEVVRFTLVTTSSAGASNISYEGIRCETGEKKFYAFGQTDGSWAAARRDSWEPIRESGANRQYAALALDYFCLDGRVAGKAAAIVERLRRQKTLK